MVGLVSGATPAATMLPAVLKERSSNRVRRPHKSARDLWIHQQDVEGVFVGCHFVRVMCSVHDPISMRRINDVAENPVRPLVESRAFLFGARLRRPDRR